MTTRRNKFMRWLRYPHGWPVAVFYVAAALVIAAAIVLSIFGMSHPVLQTVAYVMYALAALSLGYAIYAAVILLKPRIVALMEKSEFARRLMRQYGFRTIVFAIGSLTVSIAYAAFNVVIAAMSSSLWYGALAAYYALLAFMRGGIIFYHRRKRKYGEYEEDDKKAHEIRTYRRCGGLLIVLPTALGAAVLQMVLSDKSFEHPGLTIYMAAAYTFYKIIMAIINLVKARSSDDLTVRAVRNINFADALVSVLALQTAMFREFSPDSDNRLLNALMGAGVCVATAAIGIYMVVNGCKKIKLLPSASPIAPPAQSAEIASLPDADANTANIATSQEAEIIEKNDDDPPKEYNK